MVSPAPRGRAFSLSLRVCVFVEREVTQLPDLGCVPLPMAAIAIPEAPCRFCGLSFDAVLRLYPPMPDWIAVILLGIVEGITEFLPVSSTGHLLITERLLHISQSDLFNVVIQAGAVLAVIPLFHQRFHQFLFRWREPATQSYAGNSCSPAW